MSESWTWIDDSLERILIGGNVADSFVDGQKPDGLESDRGLESLEPDGRSFASVARGTVVVVDGSFVVDDDDVQLGDDVQLVVDVQLAVGQLEHCDQASLQRDGE